MTIHRTDFRAEARKFANLLRGFLKWLFKFAPSMMLTSDESVGVFQPAAAGSIGFHLISVRKKCGVTTHSVEQ
jgi:hypothetical protein